MNFKLLIGSILLLSLLVACSTTAPITSTPSAPIVPTVAPTTVPSLPATATQLPQATATLPAPTLEDQIALTTTPSLKPLTSYPAHSAPQLFFMTSDGLMKVNADGSGKTRLTSSLPPMINYLRAALSSQGDLLAFRSGDAPIEGYMVSDVMDQPLMLNLFDVQAGTVKSITRLVSPEMEQSLKTMSSGNVITSSIVNAATAVGLNDALAWSPDGRYLAFVAVIDGPSSDVYSYDRETEQILRLTDGPNDAAHLLWSPDSKWIVHEEVGELASDDVVSESEGEANSIRAIWAAALDGSGNRKLYDAVETGRAEALIDWVSPDTLLTRVSVFGRQYHTRLQLRLVSLTTGESQLITPATEVMQTRPFYSGEPSDHVYRWAPQAKRLFTKSAGSAISLALDGTVKTYPSDSELSCDGQAPLESPDGAWLLGWGNPRSWSEEPGQGSGPVDNTQPGLRLYTAAGQLQREITTGVAYATWSPDSTSVFYESGGALYYLAIPNGEPQLIEKNLVGAWGMILSWVQP